ncbi:hypothetical protein [Bacillus tequilensis]|uniref:hypothetical protein n=1 Tax=Bacillus tequilensis TaxID=227866 RepID=UPI0004650DFF|nr:hypothetical protein [Bacillus tequilensis]MDR4436154.1 hypothetical protein [Bacillus tequilensis]SPT93258.1 Uncharacterised protein [Bacillus tequilensis]
MSKSKRYLLSFTALFYTKKGYVLMFNRHENIPNTNQVPVSFEPWNRYSAWVARDIKLGTKVKRKVNIESAVSVETESVIEGSQPAILKLGNAYSIADTDSEIEKGAKTSHEGSLFKQEVSHPLNEKYALLADQAAAKNIKQTSLMGLQTEGVKQGNGQIIEQDILDYLKFNLEARLPSDLKGFSPMPFYGIDQSPDTGVSVFTGDKPQEVNDLLVVRVGEVQADTEKTVLVVARMEAITHRLYSSNLEASYNAGARFNTIKTETAKGVEKSEIIDLNMADSRGILYQSEIQELKGGAKAMPIIPSSVSEVVNSRISPLLAFEDKSSFSDLVKVARFNETFTTPIGMTYGLGESEQQQSSLVKQSQRLYTEDLDVNVVNYTGQPKDLSESQATTQVLWSEQRSTKLENSSAPIQQSNSSNISKSFEYKNISLGSGGALDKIQPKRAGSIEGAYSMSGNHANKGEILTGSRGENKVTTGVVLEAEYTELTDNFQDVELYTREAGDSTNPFDVTIESSERMSQNYSGDGSLESGIIGEAASRENEVLIDQGENFNGALEKESKIEYGSLVEYTVEEHASEVTAEEKAFPQTRVFDWGTLELNSSYAADSYCGIEIESGLSSVVDEQYLESELNGWSTHNKRESSVDVVIQHREKSEESETMSEAPLFSQTSAYAVEDSQDTFTTDIEVSLVSNNVLDTSLFEVDSLNNRLSDFWVELESQDQLYLKRYSDEAQIGRQLLAETKGGSDVLVENAKNAILGYTEFEVAAESQDIPSPGESVLITVIEGSGRGSKQSTTKETIVRSSVEAEPSKPGGDVQVDGVDVSTVNQLTLVSSMEKDETGAPHASSLDVFNEELDSGYLDEIEETLLDPTPEAVSIQDCTDITLDSYKKAEGKKGVVDLYNQYHLTLSKLEGTEDFTLDFGTLGQTKKDLDFVIMNPNHGKTESTSDITLELEDRWTRGSEKVDLVVEGTDRSGTTKDEEIEVVDFSLSVSKKESEVTLVVQDNANPSMELDSFVEEHSLFTSSETFDDGVLNKDEIVEKGSRRLISITEEEESEKNSERILELYEDDEADKSRSSIMSMDTESTANSSSSYRITIEDEENSKRESAGEIHINVDEVTDKAKSFLISVSGEDEGQKDRLAILELTRETFSEKPNREYSVEEIDDDLGIGLLPPEPPWKDPGTDLNKKGKVWLLMGKNYPAWNNWDNKKTR